MYSIDRRIRACLDFNINCYIRPASCTIALGMQTLEAQDGMQLIGFDGIYSKREDGNSPDVVTRPGQGEDLGT